MTEKSEYCDFCERPAYRRFYWESDGGSGFVWLCKEDSEKMEYPKVREDGATTVWLPEESEVFQS